MKNKVKKIAVIPLLIISGLAYASISATAFKSLPDSPKGVNSRVKMIRTVQEAPDVSFKDENGKTVSLRSLKGKVVFINLWATWCPPCIQEMPSINNLRNKFRDNNDLVFLMVDVDGKTEKAKAWMNSRKFDLPVFAMEGQLPQELFNGSIPTTIIVDRQNSIVGRQVGGADYMSQEMIDLIKKLLDQKQN